MTSSIATKSDLPSVPHAVTPELIASPERAILPRVSVDEGGTAAPLTDRKRVLDLLNGREPAPYLFEDVPTSKKIAINLKRNRAQDKTALMDEAALAFDYETDKHEYWNPEEFSLLYGSPIWEQSSQAQRIVLNHLYWVGYYSQIISAEIATIFFNQTANAGLYSVEEFRPVCDMLDLESAQERAHINAFRRVADQTEAALFGERVLTYPMRTPYAETMVFQDAGPFMRFWKWVQLNSYTLLSSNNAFIGCQYFLVRGVRTLCGKIVQHQLSQYYTRYDRSLDEGGQNKPKDDAPVPSKISYYHFCDESYHFNSSTIVSHDVVKSLKPPTAFERAVVNMGLAGAQKDHRVPSSMVNGIFWSDVAAFASVYKILTSRVFGLDDKGAREMIRKSFCEENESLHRAQATHDLARESYVQYLADLDFVTPENKSMRTMAKSSVQRTVELNRHAYDRAMRHAVPLRGRA
jgi:hypothetical protein